MGLYKWTGMLAGLKLGGWCDARLDDLPG